MFMHPETHVTGRPTTSPRVRVDVADSMPPTADTRVPTVADATGMIDIDLGFGAGPETPTMDMGAPSVSMNLTEAIDIDFGFLVDMPIKSEPVRISAPPPVQESLSDGVVDMSYTDLMSTTIQIWEREHSGKPPVPRTPPVPQMPHETPEGADMFAENERRGVETLAKFMADSTGSFMGEFMRATAEHMKHCNGSDGHRVYDTNFQDSTKWAQAYDNMQQTIQTELDTNPELQAAVAKGELTLDQQAKLQEKGFKAYEKVLGVDTSKLRAMTQELLTTQDRQVVGLMMQSALSHVGCACHSPISVQAVGAVLNNREHKHSKIYCECGWSGVACESEPCPRCQKKEWIPQAKFKAKFNKLKPKK